MKGLSILASISMHMYGSSAREILSNMLELPYGQYFLVIDLFWPFNTINHLQNIINQFSLNGRENL